MDRHLLYYRWEVQKGNGSEQDEPLYTEAHARETDAEKGKVELSYTVAVELILVSSILPFDYDPMARAREERDFGSKHQAMLQQKTTRIWNHQGSPAIRISKEEIATLGLILGIKIENRHKTFAPEGRGGFGTCLTLNKLRGLTVLRLIQRSDHPSIINTRGGSGYSILFAKHLACGYIPFARDSGTDRA